MKNMKTKWMSILELLKRILMEYCPLFIMMEAYSNSIQVAKVQLVNTLYFTCNSFDLKFAHVLKMFHEFCLYWSLLCKC